MSPYSDTYHDSESLLFLLNAVCLAEKQQIPIFIIPISIILGLSIVEIVIIGNKYDIVMFAYKEVNNICGVSIIIDFIKIKN